MYALIWINRRKQKKKGEAYAYAKMLMVCEINICIRSVI